MKCFSILFFLMFSLLSYSQEKSIVNHYPDWKAYNAFNMKNLSNQDSNEVIRIWRHGPGKLEVIEIGKDVSFFITSIQPANDSLIFQKYTLDNTLYSNVLRSFDRYDIDNIPFGNDLTILDADTYFVEIANSTSYKLLRYYSINSQSNEINSANLFSFIREVTSLFGIDAYRINFESNLSEGFYHQGMMVYVAFQKINKHYIGNEVYDKVCKILTNKFQITDSTSGFNYPSILVYNVGDKLDFPYYTNEILLSALIKLDMNTIESVEYDLPSPLISNTKGHSNPRGEIRIKGRDFDAVARKKQGEKGLLKMDKKKASQI